MVGQGRGMRQPGMNLVSLYEYGLVCLREHLLKSDVSAHPRPTSQVNGTLHQSPVLHMYSHGLMLFHSTALPLARSNQRASSSMSANCTVLYKSCTGWRWCIGCMDVRTVAKSRTRVEAASNVPW